MSHRALQAIDDKIGVADVDHLGRAAPPPWGRSARPGRSFPPGRRHPSGLTPPAKPLGPGTRPRPPSTRRPRPSARTFRSPASEAREGGRKDARRLVGESSPSRPVSPSSSRPAAERPDPAASTRIAQTLSTPSAWVLRSSGLRSSTRIEARIDESSATRIDHGAPTNRRIRADQSSRIEVRRRASTRDGGSNSIRTRIAYGRRSTGTGRSVGGWATVEVGPIRSKASPAIPPANQPATLSP